MRTIVSELKVKWLPLLCFAMPVGSSGSSSGSLFCQLPQTIVVIPVPECVCAHACLWWSECDRCIFLRDVLISTMLYTTHTVLSNALWKLSLLSETTAIFKGSQTLTILLKCEHMLIELLGCYKNLTVFLLWEIFFMLSLVVFWFFFIIIIPQIHHQWKVTKVLVIVFISGVLPFFCGLQDCLVSLLIYSRWDFFFQMRVCLDRGRLILFCILGHW